MKRYIRQIGEEWPSCQYPTRGGMVSRPYLSYNRLVKMVLEGSVWGENGARTPRLEYSK